MCMSACICAYGVYVSVLVIVLIESCNLFVVLVQHSDFEKAK